MDVAAWLRGLDLERYAPAFLENRIKAAVIGFMACPNHVGPGSLDPLRGTYWPKKLSVALSSHR